MGVQIRSNQQLLLIKARGEISTFSKKTRFVSDLFHSKYSNKALNFKNQLIGSNLPIPKNFEMKFPDIQKKILSHGLTNYLFNTDVFILPSQKLIVLPSRSYKKFLLLRANQRKKYDKKMLS